jgi:hypothetical protein
LIATPSFASIGKLVDNHDLTFLDDVFHVTLVDGVRA